MAITSEEGRQAAGKVLSAINVITRLGGGDTTVSGNATITLMCNAILAFPEQAGGNQGAREACCRGLKLGVLIGALSETHGFSTIATMRDAVAAQAPNADANTDKELP